MNYLFLLIYYQFDPNKKGYTKGLKPVQGGPPEKKNEKNTCKAQKTCTRTVTSYRYKQKYVYLYKCIVEKNSVTLTGFHMVLSSIQTMR